MQQLRNYEIAAPVPIHYGFVESLAGVALIAVVSMMAAGWLPGIS